MKNLLIILSFLSFALVGSGLFAQERVPLHTLMNKEGKYYSGDILYTGTGYSLHSNGQLGFQSYYKEGNPDGLWRSWYENGQLKSEANYKEGNPDGLWRGWHENGQLGFQSYYKEGNPDGLWRGWHENGQLASEEYYKDG
ncbi:MAG TPA: toxin-antitoxin system YwqK family antitoxin, partial [Bacteroidetes bacterium]|nr:toxin-antitoxin system YwqK family antitoxin [Bacteroidota bacterium]